jgi:hypothetical protein
MGSVASRNSGTMSCGRCSASIVSAVSDPARLSNWPIRRASARSSGAVRPAAAASLGPRPIHRQIALQLLGQQADAGHRRAQLMRGVGDEAALQRHRLLHVQQQRVDALDHRHRLGGHVLQRQRAPVVQFAHGDLAAQLAAAAAGRGAHPSPAAQGQQAQASAGSTMASCTSRMSSVRLRVVSTTMMDTTPVDHRRGHRKHRTAHRFAQVAGIEQHGLCRLRS